MTGFILNLTGLAINNTGLDLITHCSPKYNWKSIGKPKIETDINRTDLITNIDSNT